MVKETCPRSPFIFGRFGSYLVGGSRQTGAPARSFPSSLTARPHHLAIRRHVGRSHVALPDTACGPTTATGHQPPFPPIILSCAAAGAEAPFHTHRGRASVLKGVHVSWPHWMQPLEKLPMGCASSPASSQLSSHTAPLPHLEENTEPDPEQSVLRRPSSWVVKSPFVLSFSNRQLISCVNPDRSCLRWASSTSSPCSAPCRGLAGTSRRGSSSRYRPIID